MSETMLVGSMIIVGGFVSVVLDFIKASYGSVTGYKAKLMLLALSLIGGALYHVLQATGTIGTAMVILGSASTIYGLFLKKS